MSLIRTNAGLNPQCTNVPSAEAISRVAADLRIDRQLSESNRLCNISVVCNIESVPLVKTLNCWSCIIPIQLMFDEAGSSKRLVVASIRSKSHSTTQSTSSIPFLAILIRVQTRPCPTVAVSTRTCPTHNRETSTSVS